MMLAVFHQQQADGRYRATCDSWPDWSCEAASLEQSRELANDSLHAHITGRTFLAHYVVPDVNSDLRAAA